MTGLGFVGARRTEIEARCAACGYVWWIVDPERHAEPVCPIVGCLSVAVPTGRGRNVPESIEASDEPEGELPTEKLSETDGGGMR